MQHTENDREVLGGIRHKTFAVVGCSAMNPAAFSRRFLDCEVTEGHWGLDILVHRRWSELETCVAFVYVT